MAPRRSLATLAVTMLLAVSQQGAAEMQKQAVEHIKCQACELAMESAVEHAEQSKEKDEDTLADIVDGLCTVKKIQGKWTAKQDIQKKNGELKLVAQGGIGKCKSECAAVQRACTAVLKNKEDTIVSLLQAGKDAATLKTKACKKICAKKLPALVEWKDEAYDERDPKEVEAEERVEKMRAETGQNFRMWSRDEIASMSEADIELEAAKDALGAARREAKLKAEAENKGIRPAMES